MVGVIICVAAGRWRFTWVTSLRLYTQTRLPFTFSFLRSFTVEILFLSKAF
jgi:hypothetical protein